MTQRGRAATEAERGRSPSAARAKELRLGKWGSLTLGEAAADGDRPRSGTVGNLHGVRGFCTISVGMARMVSAAARKWWKTAGLKFRSRRRENPCGPTNVVMG